MAPVSEAAEDLVEHGVEDGEVGVPLEQRDPCRPVEAWARRRRDRRERLGEPRRAGERGGDPRRPQPIGEVDRERSPVDRARADRGHAGASSSRRGLDGVTVVGGLRERDERRRDTRSR